MAAPEVLNDEPVGDANYGIVVCRALVRHGPLKD